jgi:hypothetical protein
MSTIQKFTYCTNPSWMSLPKTIECLDHAALCDPEVRPELSSNYALMTSIVNAGQNASDSRRGRSQGLASIVERIANCWKNSTSRAPNALHQGGQSGQEGAYGRTHPTLRELQRNRMSRKHFQMDSLNPELTETEMSPRMCCFGPPTLASRGTVMFA